VCDLYIPHTHAWNEEGVRNSFILLEVEEVLNIKPDFNIPTDVVAWVFEKNGIFSVCSAYRLLKDEQTMRAMAANGEARASRGDRARSLVWKLNYLRRCGCYMASVAQFLAIKNGAETETYCPREPL
jgi:hypothetical protein